MNIRYSYAHSPWMFHEIGKSPISPGALHLYLHWNGKKIAQQFFFRKRIFRQYGLRKIKVPRSPAWGTPVGVRNKKWPLKISKVRHNSIFCHKYSHIVSQNVSNVKLIKIIIVLTMLMQYSKLVLGVKYKRVAKHF